MLTIPLARPSFDHRELEAIKFVLDTGMIVQGSKVEQFEKRLERAQDTSECVVVSSGTAALHLLFLACGLGVGDAVFIPSFAWPSAANMAVRCGARPVFVDVQEDNYNIDPEDLHNKIHDCLANKWGVPKAIVVVHEFGLMANMDEVINVSRQEGIQLIIEDAACALGARDSKNRFAASIGQGGILSFHPRKAITTGEGGAILTNNISIKRKVENLRNHGQEFLGETREFTDFGYNYRMTDIQAAIGLVQLEKLPKIIEERRQIAGLYTDMLKNLKGIDLPASPSSHTWQTYMVVLNNKIKRENIIHYFFEKSIQVAPGSISSHCLQVYQHHFGYRTDDLPVSARLHSQGLALPLYAGMGENAVVKVTETLKDALI